jgi:hypothetical protein
MPTIPSRIELPKYLDAFAHEESLFVPQANL